MCASTRNFFDPSVVIGRRNHGRPLKRFLDMWDRNGSTSGPTPWKIYDDDDDDEYPTQFFFICTRSYFLTVWCWRRMEKISWTDHVRNEEVLLRVNEQRNILHEVRKRKANWTGHILRRNCLLQQVMEGKIKGQIEVTRRWGRRRKKLLDDLKDRRGYCQLKEEVLDRTMWRNRFGRGFGPVVWQITDDDVILSYLSYLHLNVRYFHLIKLYSKTVRNACSSLWLALPSVLFPSDFPHHHPVCLFFLPETWTWTKDLNFETHQRLWKFFDNCNA